LSNRMAALCRERGGSAVELVRALRLKIGRSKDVRSSDRFAPTMPNTIGETPVQRGGAKSESALTGGGGAGMMRGVVVTLRVLVARKCVSEKRLRGV